MAQAVLPIFSPGTNTISRSVGFSEKDDTIFYFLGQFPIYFHAKDDINSFRFITAQLVVSGNAKQVEIIEAFGVPPISVKRSVKILREEGIEGFSKKRKGGVPYVLTPEIVSKAQKYLDDGLNPRQVAEKLNLKSGSTIRKAIDAGRLKKNSK